MGKPGKRRGLSALSLGIAFILLAIDLWSKETVLKHLPHGQSTPLLGNFLQLHPVRNSGAAFSMGENMTIVFTLISALAAAIILWQVWRLGAISWAVTLGLLLGGVLGNLYDRLTRPPGFGIGHVIDFISMPWLLPAIYNIADAAIVCSMIMLAALSIWGPSITGASRSTTKRETA